MLFRSEQIVILNDIFDIIKFINPTAIKILLSEDSMIEKYIFVREKARICEPLVETRHHLYYAWIFYGFRMLPSDYPSYDSSGNNSINNTTRWVSKLMKTSEFYNNYQHFYISGTTTTTSEEYFMYETPSTRMYNWQWSSNPSDFQPENGVYQCTRAANFSSLGDTGNCTYFPYLYYL